MIVMGKSKKDKKNKEVSEIDSVLKEKEYLTDLELSRITINAEKHEVHKKLKEILDLKKYILQLKKELYESKIETIQKESLLLERFYADQKSNHDAFKEVSKKDLEDIGKAHGIEVTSKFGYNPENGEIII